MAEARTRDARISIRLVSGACLRVRRQDTRRVSRLWTAPIFENGGILGPALGPDADSQWLEGYSGAHLRSLHAASLGRNSQGGLGESEWRAYGALGGMA